MNDYADEQAVVIWELDEPVEAASRRLIWSFGVRTRPGWELDFFLDTLEEKGSCDVIVKDTRGNGFYFSCRLTRHALAA